MDRELKDENLLEITVSQDHEGIEAGSTPSLICKTFAPVSSVWWSFKEKNLTSIKESDSTERFDLKKATRQDSGNYSCNAIISNKHIKKAIHIRVIGMYSIITIKTFLNNKCFKIIKKIWR